jgi:hypothetical protein
MPHFNNICGDSVREFDVGEEVWIIYPRLAVKCKITELDDYFRKTEPTAYLFYDLDEPIGHSLSEDELYETKEEALNDLLCDFEEEVVGLKNAGVSKEEVKATGTPRLLAFKNDLETSRLKTLGFIRGAHNNIYNIHKFDDLPQEVKDEAQEMMKQYPHKEEGKDWIRISEKEMNEIIDEIYNEELSTEK